MYKKKGMMIAIFWGKCHSGDTMKYSLPLSLSLLLLVACVDKTGLSADSTKIPHPKTNANAVAVVTEYGDFQCPACKSAYTLIDKPLVEKYGTQIRFDFMHFPLTSIHQHAMEAAEASECAADQGKFWEFVDLDYTNQDQLSSSAIDDWGKQLGLDMDLFKRCRASHIKRKAILAEYDAGTKLGVNGTPTFFVNGVKVPSTMGDISAEIDKALGSAGKNL